MVSTSPVSVHLHIVPSSVLWGVYRGARLCHTNTNFSSGTKGVEVTTEQVRTDYRFPLLTLSFSCSVLSFHIASPSVTPPVTLVIIFLKFPLFGFFHSRLLSSPCLRCHNVTSHFSVRKHKSLVRSVRLLLDLLKFIFWIQRGKAELWCFSKHLHLNTLVMANVKSLPLFLTFKRISLVFF